MNIQAIRQRFSLFLKQFRIEDLKLLMKFLEIIVNEYKNSRASRLFDLLSETPNIDIDEFNIEYEENISEEYDTQKNQRKLKNGHNTPTKIQNEKYRRLKLLNARKRLHTSIYGRRSFSEKESNSSSLKKSNTKESDDINNDPSITSTNKEFSDTSNLTDNNGMGENDYIDNVCNKESSLTEKEGGYDQEELNGQEQMEPDEINEEKTYAKNRQALSKLIDSAKKFSRPFTYNETGLSNDHSNYPNQNLNYLDEEAIDRMFETNSNDGYIDNDDNMATTSYTNTPNTKNSTHWIMKRNSQPIESGMISNLKDLTSPTSMVKGVTKCSVCSDAASGTRYGVCVCEGCKEFFRRQRENTSHRLLYCVNGTNGCVINVNNRTQCRKCRLDKCIKLGMKLIGK